MVRREIEIDEDTDRILAELASDYQGDLGSALADLVHAHSMLEEIAEQSEEPHATVLRAQRDTSEADFRERRAVAWEDVRRATGCADPSKTTK